MVNYQPQLHVFYYFDAWLLSCVRCLRGPLENLYQGGGKLLSRHSDAYPEEAARNRSSCWLGTQKNTGLTAQDFIMKNSRSDLLVGSSKPQPETLNGCFCSMQVGRLPSILATILDLESLGKVAVSDFQNSMLIDEYRNQVWIRFVQRLKWSW